MIRFGGFGWGKYSCFGTRLFPWPLGDVQDLVCSLKFLC